MKSFTIWREQLDGDDDALKIEKIGSLLHLATVHLKDVQQTGGLARPISQMFYEAMFRLEEIKKIVDSLKADIKRKKVDASLQKSVIDFNPEQR